MPRLVHLLRPGLIGLARFDIFERRLTGKPPHIGEATTLWLGLRSDSHPNAQACALGAPGFDAAEKRLVRPWADDDGDG